MAGAIIAPHALLCICVAHIHPFPQGNLPPGDCVANRHTDIKMPTTSRGAWASPAGCRGSLPLKAWQISLGIAVGIEPNDVASETSSEFERAL